MTLRGKALPLFVAAVLLAGPALIVLANLPAPPTTASTEMKRVPQHLMSPAPGTDGVPAVESGPALTSRPLGTRATGTDRVVVLPIQFTDVTHAPAHTSSFFDSMMNAPTGQSVNAFYRENSYGTFGFSATTAAWATSSHTMAYYGQDGSGVDDATGPIYRLVAEAVRLADPFVDFSQYDQDGDGVVDHVVVVHAGGAQEASSNTNLIWSHRWAVIDGDPSVPGDQRLVADGVQIYGYVMISEDSPFGVVAHEFGHDLGLPDLYDTDGSSQGVGVWDVMGSGSWNGNPRGTSPADFSAWSKEKLGWVVPIEVSAPRLSQAIRQVENNSEVFRLTVKTSPGGDEYFLVENREQSGSDAALPGRGILIWHIDDSVQNNDNDAHRLVDLVEADEATNGDTPNDAGDPWSSNAVGWGPDTNPNSNGYGNIRTGWKVRNIGSAGSVMSADLSREVDDDLAVVRILNPVAASTGAVVAVTVTLRNQGTRAQTNVVASLRVFLDTLDPAAEDLNASATRVVPTFASGAFQNLSWSFTASGQGRYILDARVNLTADEIPENNERLAHTISRTFVDGFHDDVEAGAGTWTTPDQIITDAYQWQIVDDSQPYGKSHSPTHAWRFGYVGGIPRLSVYNLTSRSVTVSGGRLYLAYYQTYDLSRTETPTQSETDHAYVDIRVDSGPWQQIAHFYGKDLNWQAVSLNLTSYLPGGISTLQFKFRATSSIMPNTGGWWVDDIMLIATNLSRAVAVIPVVSDRTIEPGAEAAFTFKVANIGDYDDEFRFGAVLPSGWTAVLASNNTTSVDAARVTLAPDAEASLQFRVQSPAGVLRGTVEAIPLTVSSTTDANARAVFVGTARINDPLGLGGIQKYIVWLIVLGILLVVVIILVDHAKSRKFRGQIR